MKVKSLLKISGIGLLFLAFTVSGCFPDDKLVYDGPLQVEFKYPQNGTIDMSLSEDTYNMQIQLIGKQQETDLVVKFEVDEASAQVLGDEFEFVNGLSTVIPANNSFGTITVNLDLAKAQKRKISVTLLGDDVVKAAANYKTFELTVK